jgi:hypothetical protein
LLIGRSGDDWSLYEDWFLYQNGREGGAADDLTSVQTRDLCSKIDVS